MKYFTIFLLVSYMAGLLLWKANPRLRKTALLVLCLLLPFAFYFLHKI